MKGKILLEAMENIPEKYILEAVAVPRAKKVFTKRAAAALIAAALCLLLAVGSFAAAHVWHEELANFFGADQKQMELLDGAAAYPEISVSSNGVTVTVLQTLADSRGVYVLYEVRGPEDFRFDDTVIWGYDTLFAPKEEGAISGFGGNKILKDEGNTRTAMSRYISDVPLKAGKMSLYLENLYRLEENSIEWPLLIEGVWQLEWDFVYEDSSLLICENEALGNRTIEELRLSPMSLYLCMAEEDGFLPSLRINFRDGDVMEIEPGTFSVSGNGTQLYHSFPEFIDLTEVLSVEVGEKAFRLK